LFVMLAGRAAVLRGAKPVAALGPGDVFGEISLLTRGPATATVATQSKSFLLQLARADFDELIMTHPHILEYVNDLAQKRNPGAEDHVLVL
jgi:CRP-like cAMP-binding protein